MFDEEFEEVLKTLAVEAAVMASNEEPDASTKLKTELENNIIDHFKTLVNLGDNEDGYGPYQRSTASRLWQTYYQQEPSMQEIKLLQSKLIQVLLKMPSFMTKHWNIFSRKCAILNHVTTMPLYAQHISCSV